MEVVQTVAGSADVIPDDELIINPYLHVIQCSDDEILVKHGSRSLSSEVIRDHGRTGLLGGIVPRYRRPTTLRDLIDAGAIDAGHLDEVRQLVANLRERGVLVGAGEHPASAYLKIRGGREAERIGSVRVGIAGAGGLGWEIARELAELGVGEIRVVDDRLLSKVPDATSDAAGRGDPQEAAAVVLERALRRRGCDNARAVVRPLEEAGEELFGAVDLGIVALERFSPSIFHRVNDAALRTKTPWLLTFVDGSEAVIGPLFVPGQTGCYAEFEVQRESNMPFAADYLVFKESLTTAEAGWNPLPPLLGNAVTAWAVMLTLPFLLGGRSHLLDRAVHLDFETMSLDPVPVLRLPRCPACAGLRAEYRHTFL